MTRRPNGERGSATVWVVALAAELAVVGAAVVLVGAAVVARHRAGVAADFAALAGAQRAVLGDADPCATARRLAEANGARLAACSAASDGVVDVSTVVPVRLGRLGVHEATARARAGPALGTSPGRAEPDQKTRSSSRGGSSAGAGPPARADPSARAAG